VVHMPGDQPGLVTVVQIISWPEWDDGKGLRARRRVFDCPGLNDGLATEPDPVSGGYHWTTHATPA